MPPQHPKRSPGPWEAVHGDGYCSINADDEHEVCVKDFPDDVDLGNFELIAAAGDLLRTLTALLIRIEQEFTPAGAGWNEETKARAAIAKANQEPVQ